MTKKELEQIADIRKELETLKKRLSELPDYHVHDMVQTSRSVIPYDKISTRVSGVVEPVEKSTMRIKHVELCQKLEKELERFLGWLETVDDSFMRQILYLKYYDGLSDEEVGKKLGYERSAVTKRLNRFFKVIQYSGKSKGDL